MGNVTSLGYVGIEASDLPAWKRFGVEILGLQLADENEDELVFRMDDHEYRMIIKRGPADDLAFTGWEVGTTSDLSALVERLRAATIEVTEASASETAVRRVEKMYVCVDPDGNRVELYCGPAITNSPFRSSTNRSAFVTGSQGLGHYFLISKGDRQKTLDFYVDLLGFKISDYIRQEIAPGIVADAAFLHCNGRHHTMAVARLPIPKQIHHLLIEVADIFDVGAAYDRAVDAGCSIDMSLGMHPNDKMFSFYVRSPSGISIEFGWGGLIIDDATWTVKSFDRLSEWGHRPTVPHAVNA